MCCGAGRRCSGLAKRRLSGVSTMGAGSQEVVREVDGDVMQRGESLPPGEQMEWPRSPKPIRGSPGRREVGVSGACHSSE